MKTHFLGLVYAILFVVTLSQNTTEKNKADNIINLKKDLDLDRELHRTSHCRYISSKRRCKRERNCRWSYSRDRCVGSSSRDYDCEYISRRSSCNRRRYCTWDSDRNKCLNNRF